ncbi:MAG: hypothetical protein M3Y64_01255, partial [Gemmatimonadota bacterium]|nr:hypothetical protein [Gemmatimonadota bacterium]
MQTVRTVVGYTALAVGVTVGGVGIGAVVIAPVVAPIVAHTSNHAPELHTATGNSSNSVSVAKLAGDFVRAIPGADRVPDIVWLFVAAAGVLVLLALVGWRVRRRPGAKLSVARLGTTATAIQPSRIADRTSGTPRAVVALAEAGTASADIARRTGLSLDAVSLCLA